MLELNNLVKSYETADFVQQALDGVSVTLRDNEFVAVLGPSGSGKTTLLNIIGGLDRYDSGDLIIDGISTKLYKDRDWDTYRNNRVGFVFQSYNLIPHQTVLANVELALTLSGVARAERRERARKALIEVGLEEHITKKPNQLSGGQMQRVAIARALINDPEILLADEPTGALDSKTSVQIMDLLQQIAADRLVVMVTHNPELAEEYANRIIQLSDGRVVGDTNPVAGGEAVPEARPPRRARMSFFTAVALSFSNLMTKKGRTLMMAFAGSIGIIGIAGILALSNGVNNYIKTVEEDTLSVYPLSIQSTGIDMTSLLMGGMGDSSDESEGSGSSGSGASGSGASGSSSSGSGAGADEGVLKETPMVSSMLDKVQSNDLAALKTYLDSPESGIAPYVNTIQYSYDVTPQIYLPATEPEVHQVHPDRSFSALGLGSGMSSSSLMSLGMSTDVFSELIDDRSLYSEQYEVLAGDWPQGAHELVLVVGSNHRLADFFLYSMGLKDYHELKSMMEAFVNEEPIVTSSTKLSFTYEQIMDLEFRLVYNVDYFTHDDTYDVWVDRSDDAEFVKGLVSKAVPLRVSGIVAAKEGANTLMLSSGMYYTSALVEDVVKHAKDAKITKYQLAHPELNVFTGNTFVEEADRTAQSEFDMSNLFSIDEEAMGNAFQFDESALTSGMDFSSLLNPSAIMGQMPAMDMTAALGGIQPPQGMDTAIGTAMQNAMGTALPNLIGGYINWYTTVSGQDPTTYPASDVALHFNDYLNDPNSGAQGILAGAMGGIATDPAMAQYQEQMAAYQAQMQGALANYIQGYMMQMLNIMQAQLSYNMQNAMAGLSTTMADAMHIDQDVFASAFQFNLDEEELTALMLSMMGTQQSSLDGNLRKLGYADFDKPSSIALYPFDFEGKQHVLDILDSYNKRMEDEGADEKVITYTDIVGTLMSSVTEIIDMISLVLVAFVAISLVVSSIMIGIITYISVLERKKEIGILRSIGASKGDIGNVFNAETLIVGLVAGCMGIGITLLASLPVNIIVMQIYSISNLVLLPWTSALILIGVSCLLTFVAGLMPSSAASRKDPVEALRSE